MPCLDSILKAIKNAPYSCEIVVVNNASVDNTVAVVEDWQSKNDIAVRFITEPRKGVSYARNTAIAAASGRLLVFTDDDCRLDANFIIEAVAYDRIDTAPVLRGGSVYLGDPIDLPLTILTGTTLQRWQRSNNSARTHNIGNTLAGCNMVMRRELLDEIGMFDTTIGPGARIPASEDTDLIFRAYLKDIPIEYVPDMRVYHFHGRRLQTDGFKLMRNYSVGNGALYAKYILKYPPFCYQLLWDIKGVLREIRRLDNHFDKNAGFSLKHKLFYNFKGAVMYLFAAKNRTAA